MFQKLTISIDERAVLFKDGLPVRALGPGAHWIWGRRAVQRWTLSALVFEARAEVRAVLPSDWYEEVVVGPGQRAIVSLDGRPRLVLRPGTHRLWQVDETLLIELVSLDEPMPELTKELRAILSTDEYLAVEVKEWQLGLLYTKGRFVRVLPPGQHTLWSPAEAKSEVQLVDMRLQQLLVASQDLMTKDKVSLRVSITVEYAVVDAPRAAHAAVSARDTLYLQAQLAAREYVSAVTLDELLLGRDAMPNALVSAVVPKGTDVGVRVARVGIKDVILPGEMKALLNRVIEAEKEAAANVILRREETAATRSLANTAKVLADNPVLLRMKELEALEKMAASIKEVRVVVGADGVRTLLPTGLLVDEPPRT